MAESVQSQTKAKTSNGELLDYIRKLEIDIGVLKEKLVTNVEIDNNPEIPQSGGRRHRAKNTKKSSKKGSKKSSKRKSSRRKH